MTPIRVLVVDDSVVIRRMLREALAGDSRLEVVGVAANGQIALALMEQLSPDIVTLDVEMPEMDGLEVLRHMRVKFPAMPAIMFSTLTHRGAAATLDALALGARDYVTKPENVGNVIAGIERIREELIPKICALCGRRESAPRPIPPRRVTPLALRPQASPIEILAIGTSTGGPNALSAVLPHIPADFPVPIVIVQHMPPAFTRFLAERLNTSCAIDVVEAAFGQELVPGKAYIAPGDFHMLVAPDGTKRGIKLKQSPPENSCRPSVDVLFRSVAEVYRSSALALIMTGMGQDGLRGCEQLHEVGARIFAQDEATSVVWGMPGFVVEAGLAERVLPLSQIATEIVRAVLESQRVYA